MAGFSAALVPVTAFMRIPGRVGLRSRTTDAIWIATLVWKSDRGKTKTIFYINYSYFSLINIAIGKCVQKFAEFVSFNLPNWAMLLCRNMWGFVSFIFQIGLCYFAEICGNEFRFSSYDGVFNFPAMCDMIASKEVRLSLRGRLEWHGHTLIKTIIAGISLYNPCNHTR